MDGSQLLEPWTFIFPFSFSFYPSYPRTSLRASREILRERWMYGWQARPCMNLHGMYRWFGVVPHGCVLFFTSFFVVIFWTLCCDIRGGVLRMISRGFCSVSCMRTLCLFGWWLCPQNLPWIRLDLVVSRVARVLALESRNIRFLLIVSDSGRFFWGRGCPGGNLGIPEVLLQSMELFGRSGDGKLRFDPRVDFLEGAV
jgi:hypothetical protein